MIPLTRSHEGNTFASGYTKSAYAKARAPWHQAPSIQPSTDPAAPLGSTVPSPLRHDKHSCKAAAYFRKALTAYRTSTASSAKAAQAEVL
ncbi:hypothetical protein BST61_g970 [Cercospora zeina]